VQAYRGKLLPRPAWSTARIDTLAREAGRGEDLLEFNI